MENNPVRDAERPRGRVQEENGECLKSGRMRIIDPSSNQSLLGSGARPKISNVVYFGCLYWRKARGTIGPQMGRCGFGKKPNSNPEDL